MKQSNSKYELIKHLLYLTFVLSISFCIYFLIQLSQINQQLYNMETLIFKIKCYKEWLSINKNGSQFRKKVGMPKYLNLFIEDNLIKISSNIFSAQSVVEEEKSLEIKEFCSFLVSQERKFECFWTDAKKMLWNTFDGLSSSQEIKNNTSLQKQSSSITDVSKKIHQLMDAGIELSNRLISQMKHITETKPDNNTLQILRTTLKNNIQFSKRSIIFPDLNIKKQDSFIQNYVIPEQSLNQIEEPINHHLTTKKDKKTQDQQKEKKIQVQKNSQYNINLKRIIQEKTQFQGYNFEKKKKYENPFLEIKPDISQRKWSGDELHQTNIDTLKVSQTNFYIPQHKSNEQKIKEKIKQSMKKIKNNQQKIDRLAEKPTVQYVRTNSKKPSFLSPKGSFGKVSQQTQQVSSLNQKKQLNFHYLKPQNLIIHEQDKENPQLFKKNQKRTKSIDVSNQYHQHLPQSLNSFQEKKLDEITQENYRAQQKKLVIKKLANIDEYAKATLSMYKPQQIDNRSLPTFKQKRQIRWNEQVLYQNLDSNIFQPVNSQLFASGLDSSKKQNFSSKDSLLLIDDTKQSSQSNNSSISFGA